MKGLAGWTPNSKMAGRYIHLSGRDHVDAVLESQGIEVPERQRLKPMLSEGRCPQCDALIGASMLHCPGCGYVLDPTLREKPGEISADVAELLRIAEEKKREFLAAMGKEWDRSVKVAAKPQGEA